MVAFFNCQTSPCQNKSNLQVRPFFEIDSLWKFTCKFVNKLDKKIDK